MILTASRLSVAPFITTSLLLLSALIPLSQAGFLDTIFGNKIKVGAFNVQAFGKTKTTKPLVMKILSIVICRYDIMVLQEIRDIDNIALDNLSIAVNSRCPTFGMRVSPRAGTTSSQEQIAFFYRMKKVLPEDSYLSGSTQFERPPFSGLFRSAKDESFKFVLVAAHLKPTAAVDELNALPAVYQASMNKWKQQNVKVALMLGDFNADCSYVSNAAWNRIKLREDTKFHWLITDQMKTNVNEDCSYDRIIVEDQYLPYIVQKSAKVDYYHRLFSVRWRLFFSSSTTGIRDISDHFPVSVVLNSWPRKRALENKMKTPSVSLVNTIPLKPSHKRMKKEIPIVNEKSSSKSEKLVHKTPSGTKLFQTSKPRVHDPEWQPDHSDFFSEDDE